MIRRTTAWLLTAVAALAIAPAAPSHALVPQLVSCSGVWVIVDYGNGSVSTRCALSYATGAEALSSAGYAFNRNTYSLICQIDGVPDTCPAVMPFSRYWSYWHALRQADGSYGPWLYSSSGADGYTPRTGDAEGWRLGDGQTAPGARPPLIEPTPTQASTTQQTQRAAVPTVTTDPTTQAPEPTPTDTPAPSTSASSTDGPPAPSASSAIVQPAVPSGGDPWGVVATLAILTSAGASAWFLNRRGRGQ